MACLICMAMYGSGPKIVGIIVFRVHLIIVPFGQEGLFAVDLYCVEGHGITCPAIFSSLAVVVVNIIHDKIVMASV